MPNIVKRVWTSRGPTGRRVRKVAFGYSLAVNGKVERKYDSGWTREDAQAALATRLLRRDDEVARAARPVTFQEAVDRYLAAKARKKSARGDALLLGKLAADLGAD